jgi:Prophage minor tail protein Z (GPZ)
MPARPSFLFGIVPVGFKEAEIALKGIKDGYPKAAAEAINRGLLAGRTAAAKNISARYAITSAAVKNNFTTQNATWSKLEGHLVATGPMLPVGTFKVSVKKVKRGGSGPARDVVSVTIIKGQKKVIRGAFMLPNGRVMERRQPERFPIFPVSTIGVSQMASQKTVSEETQKAMNETTQARLKHNVDYALGKLHEQSGKVRLKAKTQLKAKEAA